MLDMPYHPEGILHEIDVNFVTPSFSASAIFWTRISQSEFIDVKESAVLKHSLIHLLMS